jgi:hypothetical protein
MWVMQIDPASILARNRWIQDELWLASQTLIREVGLVDMYGVVAGDEIEIV